MQRAGLVVPIRRKGTNIDAWPATRMWDQGPPPGNFKVCGRQAVERMPSERIRRHPRLPTSANMAPCGSLAWTIQLPPGTSIGPLMILPPPAVKRSSAASKSPTLK
jgi:hypothetical protein